MVPMAIPSVGGMLLQVITLFVVPVLYAIWKEHELPNAPINKKLADEK
jgi:Cu(I)/Ag(I) efflux system membrane protein CusA/SilA